MNKANKIDEFDVIIIGGGPMGLSTAYYINKLNPLKKILVLEQFSFINENSSSAGKSRQFRVQYETVPMAEMALVAEKQWLEFNKLSGEKLLDQVGSLWFGEPGISSSEGSVDDAIKVMNYLGIKYDNLPTSKDIMDNSHFKCIKDNYNGFFQADGGILNIDSTQKFLISELKKHDNIVLKDFTKVTSIDSLETGEIKVMVSDQNTGKELGYYSADQLAITVGPYVNDVVCNFGLKVDIEIWEMSSAYYKIEEAKIAEIETTWYVFQLPALENVFYGFNEVVWANPGYVRVAPAIPDCYLENPSDHTNIPSPKSLKLTDKWVKDYMPGLIPEAKYTSTCMIAISKTDRELMLDFLPETINNNKNIVVYTAGWGGKFIPTIGDLISKMLADDLTPKEAQFLCRNTRIDWRKGTC
jgi:glycine/D-amino acid oxidase-like deaminating enzyme